MAGRSRHTVLRQRISLPFNLHFLHYLHFNLETVLQSIKISNVTDAIPMNIANCGETNRLHVDRQIDTTLTTDYHCIILRYFLAS